MITRLLGLVLLCVLLYGLSLLLIPNVYSAITIIISKSFIYILMISGITICSWMILSGNNFWR